MENFDKISKRGVNDLTEFFSGKVQSDRSVGRTFMLRAYRVRLGR